MKIINFYAENLKRLTAVEISPDGNVVQITGANGQGKTSVLDAIWWALGGGKNVQASPIRKGEEKAIVRLDLGELVVTRRFNAQDDGGYTTSIVVENPDGARFGSPQDVLNKVLGELTFDPLAFMRRKPSEQASTLQHLVGDFDFDANKAKIDEAFKERTIKNRMANDSTSAASKITENLPEDLPDETPVTEVMAQWQAASDHNALLEKREEKRKAFIQMNDALSEQIAELKAQHEKNIAEIESWDDLPEPEDADAIRERLNNAQANNAVIERVKERDKLLVQAKTAKSESEALTKTMADLKKAGTDAIAAADMPIDGLGIDGDVVMLDGLPFDQASDAQQLQASIAIAMALNPKLRVIRVRDGSLLDEKALAMLEKMSAEKDYQVWIERVDTSGAVGFVLEDGHLKEDKPKASKPMFSKDA